MWILNICANEQRGTEQFSRRDILFARDQDGNSAFLQAASNPDVTCLTVLLKFKGAFHRNGGLTNKYGFGPFHVAAQSNLPRTLDILHKRNAGSVDEPSLSGRTPLGVALSLKNLEAASFLLHLGADPQFQDKDGHSPLASILSQSPVDVKLRETVLNGGYAAALARVASREGSLSVLEPLLQNPRVIFLLGEFLEEAIVNGNTVVACFLIDHGVVNQDVTENGSSPLILAISYGRTVIAEKLIEHEAFDRADAAGMNAVISAAGANDKRMLELLLSKGYCWETLSRSAVQVALEMDHKECLNLLLIRGAPVWGLNMGLCLEENIKPLLAAGWSPNNQFNTTMEDLNCYPLCDTSFEYFAQDSFPITLKRLSSEAFRNAVNTKKSNVLHQVAELKLPKGIQVLLLQGYCIDDFVQV